jgi:hypothetical protein
VVTEEKNPERRLIVAREVDRGYPEPLWGPDLSTLQICSSLLWLQYKAFSTPPVFLPCGLISDHNVLLSLEWKLTLLAHSHWECPLSCFSCSEDRCP